MKIGHHVISGPCFADDVCTLAVSKPALQQKFQVAYSYSCKWQFTFNQEKCAYVVIGKDSMPKMNITLGNKNINKSNFEEHLGTRLMIRAN